MGRVGLDRQFLRQPAVAEADKQLIELRSRREGMQAAGWSVWFGGLTVTEEEDGTTLLDGSVPDQAALYYGLLSRLRDLGAMLLTLEHLA